MGAPGHLLRSSRAHWHIRLPSTGELLEAFEVMVDRLPRPDPRALVVYRGADSRARNEARLYAEAFWTAVLAAVVAFNAAYAVRLGASTQLVGLLSSMPALVAVVATLPVGALVQRSQRRVWIVGGACWPTDSATCSSRSSRSPLPAGERRPSSAFWS